VGPRVGLDGCGKFRPPLGFDPRTVQPAVRRVWCSSEKIDPDTQGMRACVGSTDLNLAAKKQQLSLAVLEPDFLIIQGVACSNDWVFPEQGAHIELHDIIELNLCILGLFFFFENLYQININLIKFLLN